MCETTFEQRLELLTEMTNALEALNEAQKRYLAEPGNELIHKELIRLKREYQTAATALNHAVEQIRLD